MQMVKMLMVVLLLENDVNTEQGNTKIKTIVNIVAPLKYLNNVWKILDIPLINCQVSLILTWSANCVLNDIKTQNARGKRVAINAPANATFKITDVKLYVPVVTLSTESDETLLEQLRAGFKRIIKWNKYRSEMTDQAQNNNLNYLIDQHSQKSMDYLPYHLQMKTIEDLFQSIMYQLFI